MKYYQLMKYANNPVGAEFRYCSEEELPKVLEEVEPDHIDEITEEQYEEAMDRQHIRFLRRATGYPK